MQQNAGKAINQRKEKRAQKKNEHISKAVECSKYAPSFKTWSQTRCLESKSRASSWETREREEKSKFHVKVY